MKRKVSKRALLSRKTAKERRAKRKQRFYADVAEVRAFLKTFGCRLMITEKRKSSWGHYFPMRKLICMSIRGFSYREAMLILVHEAAHAYRDIVINKGKLLPKKLLDALNKPNDKRTESERKMVYEDEKRDLVYMPFIHSTCQIKYVPISMVVREYFFEIARYKHMIIYKHAPTKRMVSELVDVIVAEEPIEFPMA